MHILTGTQCFLFTAAIYLAHFTASERGNLRISVLASCLHSCDSHTCVTSMHTHEIINIPLRVSVYFLSEQEVVKLLYIEHLQLRHKRTWNNFRYHFRVAEEMNARTTFFQLDTSAKKRYTAKISLFGSIDPYVLNQQDFLQEISLLSPLR